jgi:predicted ATPase
MIDKLRVRNFKCLLDVEIELGPFTVLIGPNDSGKSSLLEAVEALNRLTTLNLSAAFPEPKSLKNLVWRKEEGRLIEWDVHGRASGMPFHYSAKISPQPTQFVEEELSIRAGERAFLLQRTQSGWHWTAPGVAGGPVGAAGIPQSSGFNFQQMKSVEIVAVASALGSSMRYRFDPEAMRKDVNSLQSLATLSANGGNLVQALDAIVNSPKRSKLLGLEKNLHDAIPTLLGISLPIVPPNQRGLAFTLAGDEDNPVSIPASLASDGAILLTAFLALAYGDAPEMIFIEEPENGLHYSILKQAVELLRDISTGKVGDKPRQVILSTHSPLLLNCVDADEVRVVQRTVEEGTKVTPLKAKPGIERLLQEFSTGELWYLFGEKELVEGVTE